MGPFGHGALSGDLEYPGFDRLNLGGDAELRWFDYWLKGIDNGIMDEPPVSYFMMAGAEKGRLSPKNGLRTSANWPPANREVRFYLTADRTLSGKPPAGEGARISYRYDPANPVPTVGGANLTFERGPMDQRAIPARQDYLRFQTPALDHDVVIAGPVKVELYGATDGPDTDFMAKLVDVYPDGYEALVLDAPIRARFRHGRMPDDVQMMTPNAPEKLTIDLRDAINRAPRLSPEIKKQLDQQLLGALNRLEGGKPILTQANRAPRVVETVGLLVAATTNTGPAAEEFWQEVVMPLLFVGAPTSFPPLDDEELAAAKQGIDPLFLFLDVVPFQFKASEEALLGAFPDLQVPAPEFRGSTQVRLIKVGTDSVKEALAAFDPQKTRDSLKRFSEFLKEKGGAAAEAKGAQEAKTMLDAAMTLLGDLKQAVASGKDIYVRRMTEAEAASEPALAQVRQALSAPRIILSP